MLFPLAMSGNKDRIGLFWILNVEINNQKSSVGYRLRSTEKGKLMRQRIFYIKKEINNKIKHQSHTCIETRFDNFGYTSTCMCVFIIKLATHK